MSFVITDDPEAFAQRAGRFIEERIECNLVATVLINARGGTYSELGARFAYTLQEQGRISAVALRIPPWPLLISPMAASQADELMSMHRAAPWAERRLYAVEHVHGFALFTDLANPTSNKIYAEVGYRVHSEWEEHEFLAETMHP